MTNPTTIDGTVLNTTEVVNIPYICNIQDTTKSVSKQGFMDFSNLDNAIRCTAIICNSGLVPDAYKGKPDMALVAIQMGIELGFKPLQSLQNIDVIKGKPALKVEAMLALCQASPDFEYCTEEFIDTPQMTTAICKVKRKGQVEHVRTFSLEDAKKAGLLGKGGVWNSHTKRMLQIRARGWALKDKFADIIYGLHLPEEVAEDSFQQSDVQSPEKFEHIGDKIKAELKARQDLVQIGQNGGIVDKDTGEITADPYDTLGELIVELKVSPETVQKWLDKAKVDGLDKLSHEQLEKLIAKLEKDKESQNVV